MPNQSQDKTHPNKTQLINGGTVRILILTVWLVIFVGRLIFHAAFYELHITDWVYKTTTVFALLLVFLGAYHRFYQKMINAPLIDQSIIIIGCFFIILSALRFDFRTAQIALLFFIIPYFLASLINCSPQLIEKIFISVAIIVACEIIIEFFLFNNHLIGLGDCWFLDEDAYLALRQRYNPQTDHISFFRAFDLPNRLDGIFGYLHTTGAYLAVASTYAFTRAKNSKRGLWIFLFALFLFGTFASTSSTPIASLIISIFVFFLIDVRISWTKKIIFLFIFLGLCFLFLTSSLGNFIYDRVARNTTNAAYIGRLFPNVNGLLQFLFFLVGFHPTGSDLYSPESDICRLIASFGIIPVSLVFIRFLKKTWWIFRGQHYGGYSQQYKAASLSVMTGFGCLVHTSATLGWGVGSVVFLFLGLIINFSEPRP